MSATNRSTLAAAFSSITGRLTATNAVRDEALKDGRQAIRFSANSVRALHRGEFDTAADLLANAKSHIDNLRLNASEFAQIYHAGYVQDAMKEYAEAAITAALLRNRALPSPEDLEVEDAAWLNALAEAGSELRRDVLDWLRRGDIEKAVGLLQHMDAIYEELITIDFPDALTGGLRRSTDQFRAVLERTRGDLTVTTQQRRLEDAIVSLQTDLRKSATPES